MLAMFPRPPGRCEPLPSIYTYISPIHYLIKQFRVSPPDVADTTTPLVTKTPAIDEVVDGVGREEEVSSGLSCT